ncbi:hypothetical protein RvY_04013-2 [Ramazzottius varieornatus]|uniref:Uncharacterized protein n=1 Tax=Ramazzottius varieornatus TaxID=947166 RepID=A0A1D1UZE2_RAMVA|nr:hypothetical protein RvY_04013-2 [Ramazzottius varieornatus]
MDSPNHKAYHLDEYIPRADKVSSSFPTSSFGKGSAMYNNNEGRQTGNSMYVMVPVPVPMGGQQNGGYGWNGPSFPVNHPSYGGSDWDNGHASSSRAALMPLRPTRSYRAYHEHRYRKNCCSCWRCAVASVIILAFIGVGTAVVGIVFLKMMRENADSMVVAGVAGNGTRGGSSSGSQDATSFDITVGVPNNSTVVVSSSGNSSVTVTTSEGNAVALMDFLGEDGTRVSAADVDLHSGNGSPNAVGIIVPPNTNITVNVTNGLPLSDAAAVGPAPLTATQHSVGAGTTGLMSFVSAPRARSNDLVIDADPTVSPNIHQMPATPVSGMGFTVNDPEVIGASSGHLFTASPGPAQLSPMMIGSVENGTMRTIDGLIDVPNPVSAVTASPAVRL